MLNLFTVLAEKGAKEVNVRKEIGGKKMNHGDARVINV
jgi:hypothetical protein